MTVRALLAEALQFGRDLGSADTVSHLPDGALAFVFGVTQLGDPWLLVAVAVLFYWFGPDRNDGALVVAITVGALALVTALKTFFGLPRPPQELQYHVASGYGFPSGHAVGATAVWGALAVLADRWTLRKRLLGASVLVVAVSLSRILLGVHFVADVVVGVAVGIGFLAMMLWVGRDRPTSAFALAVVVALIAVLLRAPDAIATLGGALGAGGAWGVLELETPQVTPIGAVLWGGSLGVLWWSVTTMEPPWPMLLILNIAVAGGIVALPRINEKVASQLPASIQNFSK